MKNRKEIKCDDCNTAVELRKSKKINGLRLCSVCDSKRRIEKRKKMINNDEELKQDLNILKNIERKSYYKSRKEANPPKIKGTKKLIKKEYSCCYLTLEEKRDYLRVLMSRGLDFNEAKEKITGIVEYLSTLRKELKIKKISEQEATLNKAKMLEELYQY